MATPLQLSDARTDGALLGQSATDKVAFFGGTPVVQPSGAAQGAITRGAAGGVVATFAVTSSPASIATLTTQETGMTLVGGTGANVTIASGDLLYVVKPTAQAGIGVGNVRLSSAGVAAVTFSNLSAGFLTPTASEKYGIVAIRGLGVTTAVLTPAAVAAATTAEQTFTVPGLAAGTLVQVSKPTVQAGLDLAGARVVSNNTLGLTFINATAGTLTPTASQTYTIGSFGGIDANDNNVRYQVTGGTLVAVTTLTTAPQGLTVTNLAASDIITSVSKPTNQAGLIVGNTFVSAAGLLGLTFGNFTTASITPTGNEVYEVGTFRPAPAAPLLLYSQTLTPTAVTANTTAEQGFTVTGLVAASPVWVNPPSVQPGVGIAGCRVSATSTLAITFANPTSASVTPPSGTYVIGNFQMPLEVTGSSTIQGASLSATQAATLANAQRSAMVSLGLMAGA